MAVAEGTKAYNPQTRETAIFTGGRWVVQGAQQMPLPEADSKSMEALQADAQQKQYLDQKAQQFVQGMDPTPATATQPARGSFATGPAYSPGGMPIPFTHSEIPNPIPTIAGRIDPRMGSLESITNQAWVHMRPEGSGAIRGFEAGDFKNAFPGVQHWGPENQRIADQLHQDSQIATHKLQFIDSFIRSGQGDYAQANAAWQANFGTPQAAAQPPGGQPAGPPPIQPPMQMVPNAQSPIGASPAPGGFVPAQPTGQQQAILNWTPDKGLHP